MEYWEFLLQKKDEPTWNVIDSEELELTEGNYRIVAHSNFVNKKVEIRVIHQFNQENHLREKIFKRFRNTNNEGLIVIIPFTHLEAGVWKFSCCSGDLMNDFLGKSWQKSIQFKVLEKGASSVISNDNTSVKEDSLFSSDLLLTDELLEKNQGESVTNLPLESSQNELIDNSSKENQGESDFILQLYQEDNVTEEKIESSEMNGEVKSKLAPQIKPNSSQYPASESLIDDILEEFEANLTEEKETLKQEDTIHHLKEYEILAEQIITEIFEEVPANDIPEKQADQTVENSAETITNDSLLSEELKPEIAKEKQENNLPSKTIITQENLVNSEINQVEKVEKKPPSKLKQKKGRTNFALQRSIQDLERLLIENEDELITEPLTDAQKIADFKVTLLENTFITKEENQISLQGAIVPIKPQENSFDQQIIKANLIYQLREPATGKIEESFEQIVTGAKLPLAFNYNLSLPSLWYSYLIVGHVTARLELEDSTLNPEATEAIFTVTLGVNKLLEKISFGAENKVEGGEKTLLPAVIDTETTVKIEKEKQQELEEDPELIIEEKPHIDLFDATKIKQNVAFVPVSHTSHFYKINKTEDKISQEKQESPLKIKSPQLPSFVKSVTSLNTSVAPSTTAKEDELIVIEETAGEKDHGEQNIEELNLDFSYQTSLGGILEQNQGETSKSFPQGDSFSVKKAEERFWLRLNSFASESLIEIPEPEVIHEVDSPEQNLENNAPTSPETFSSIDHNIDLEALRNLENLIGGDRQTILQAIFPQQPDLIAEILHNQEELESEIELTEEAKKIESLLELAQRDNEEETVVKIIENLENTQQEWEKAIAELINPVETKEVTEINQEETKDEMAELNQDELAKTIKIETEIAEETREDDLNLSGYQSLEIVVEDEEEIKPLSPNLPLKTDASGIPYPQEIWNQNQDNNYQVEQDVPAPIMIINQEELIAGSGLIIDLKLPPYQGAIYIKLWIQDRQSRNLLTGPIALVDLTPNRQGELEIMTQLTIPFGSMEITIAAVAIDPDRQRESHKIMTHKIVLPPDTNKLDQEDNFDNFDLELK